MPAPCPYTPPQPAEPPIHQTPRLSHARRLSTPTPESGYYFPQTPTSSGLGRRSSVSGSTRRQILTNTPQDQTPSVERDTSFQTPSTSQTQPSVKPGKSSVAKVGQTEDEDLKDPEFFIRTFSRVDGPLLHSDPELLEKLERYLLKVNRCEDDSPSMPGTSKDKKASASNVNFAEAALVVQGSTRIYGKKVDLLFNAAIQLFRLLSSPFEDPEEEEEGGEEDEGPSDSRKKSKKNKRLRLGLDNRELAEDIVLVDNMKEGGKIEQKKTTRPRFSELVKNFERPRCSIKFLPPNIPRLVRRTATLGTNQKEVENINMRRVPQYGLGESRGFIDEYRLNEVIRRPDSMLVEHFVAPEQDKNRARTVEGIHQTNRGFGLCDSGIDSCPSSVYNPIESIGAHETDSIIWEGVSVGVGAEADALSCADDGFVSEGIHEEGVSEEESEQEAIKMDSSGVTEASRVTGETEAVNSETERSGTESSGVCSDLGAGDDSHPTKIAEEDRETLAMSGDGDNSIPTHNRGSGSPKTSESNSSELKEVEFTPTPRRNKRKMKNVGLPCKLVLLMAPKRRKITKIKTAAQLWRPSQSPCSSASSNYPQSPVSFAPTSPDPHSLNQLMLHDDDPHDALDNLSDSENEGEFFDPPDDGRPQINYWIQNHQKDLMSAGEPITLSDQVAQWQELIMPRLEKNLQYGPYSHVKYAPVLLELLARGGWPPPENCLTDELGQSESLEANNSEEDSSGDEFELDRTLPPTRTCSSSWEDGLHESLLPYDKDFADPKEDDVYFDGEQFYGFKVAKKVRRRGVVISENAWNFEIDKGVLFSSLSQVYKWGLGKWELEALDSEKRLKHWHSTKTEWLQSKVRAGESRRNWDEWAEENDNVETSSDLGLVPFADACSGTSQMKEPVLFTSLFSGFRKEEVSRLLFTALHLASQGIVEITSEPGVLNSMKLSIMENIRT